MLPSKMLKTDNLIYANSLGVCTSYRQIPKKEVNWDKPFKKLNLCEFWSDPKPQKPFQEIAITFFYHEIF